MLAAALRLLSAGSDAAKVLNMVYEHARTEGMLEILALESNRAKRNEERRAA